MQSIAPAPHTPKGFMSHAQELTQEQSLREHLLHHVNDSNQAAAASNQRTQIGAHPQMPTTAAHNIDPAIAGPGVMSHSPNESGGDENGVADSGKKSSKRELSTSKRAAQNRAAQRAFRQRKEGHIKKLEEEVRDTAQLRENVKALERENFTLRDYIIKLQTRLLDLRKDFPPLPNDINLHRPLSSSSSGAPPSSGEYAQAPPAPMGGSEVHNSHLQQSAAQAVAGLAQSTTDPALTPKLERS